MIFDIGLGNFFLEMSLQARETKAKAYKWDYIKLKIFCAVKQTISKTKRQPTEWDKVFANDISDYGLISNTQRTHITHPQKKKPQRNLIKKWAEDLNRNFSKEDIQMINRQ